ncbi:MAG: hypothetical protein JWL77_6331 [Chthonomonadaceae bacterium]|nr:hypothetical protein [Chthonomonadaceae bacterium]
MAPNAITISVNEWGNTRMLHCRLFTLPAFAASAILTGSFPAQAASGAGALLPGFQRSPWFGEQVAEETTATGVRIHINAPAPMQFDPTRPTRLVFFATPNGNTIEQTMGSALAAGTDWHFDIQHIAAQVRRLRELDKRENLVLVCVEASGRSWPAWRQKHADNAALIRGLVEAAGKRVPGAPVRITLAGHSGGGSFLIGFLNGGDAIPGAVDRIVFLDANYSYSDEAHHGEKLLSWLGAVPDHRLVVVAYDDRNIQLNGKPVVGPDGGTYRASHRMLETFGKPAALTHTKQGDFDRYESPDARSLFLIHTNPANKILHTALVGEMNGLLMALTYGTPEEKTWGTFGGPRAYSAWVQPAAPYTPVVAGGTPTSVLSGAADGEHPIPLRTGTAEGGQAVMARVADLSTAERETLLLKEITDGNLPAFLRTFKSIKMEAKDSAGVAHTAVFEVMPDYLAVGSDSDFARTPLTPMTALQIADRFGCVLPTRKMVDAIYAQAEVKLEPHPMTESREAIKTFLEHNAIIETQRSGKPLGLLVAGIKKDVVQSVRLLEKPHRVAIYGWHKLDGSPIQPLTIVHRDTYVDYSHGIRLVKQTLLVDGKSTTVAAVLADPNLKTLLTDE